VNVQIYWENAKRSCLGTCRVCLKHQLQAICLWCGLLPEYRVPLFNLLVEMLLYICQSTWQDIQTAVAFLCTRIKRPDTDDYKKLTKLMQYLQVTSKITMTIETDEHPNWLASAMPHEWHAKWFLHQITTRIIICTNDVEKFQSAH